MSNKHVNIIQNAWIFMKTAIYIYIYIFKQN